MSDKQYGTVIYIATFLIMIGACVILFPRDVVGLGLCSIGVIIAFWAIFHRAVKRGYSLWTMRPK